MTKGFDLLLDVDEDKSQINYEIIDNIPEKSLKGLSPTIIQEIKHLKFYLSKTNSSCYNKRIKRLQKPLDYLYYAYVGHTSLRMTFEINHNTQKIILKNISTRCKAFNPKSI